MHTETDSQVEMISLIRDPARDDGSTSWMVFDGASVMYVFSICVLIIILLAIFVHRQVLRLRNNNTRREPEVKIRHILSRKGEQEIHAKLECVRLLRLAYLPKLTDCTTIAQHSNAPYMNRMIAVDEITMEIDRQLERINMEYARKPGETTYRYLMRMREIAVPGLGVGDIQRIAFLHEAARYRPEKFDIQHLMELRALLKKFLKIVNAQQSSLPAQSTPASKGPLASIKELGQRMNAGASRRRRSKFGGSDGGRILAGVVNNPLEAEEHIALLPMNVNSPARMRRGDSQPRLNML